MKKPIIYTVGHSNRTIEQFVEILQNHGVRQIVDVRSVPKSRHNPQFNSDSLKQSLQKAYISYKRIEKLGGFRHTTKDSVNLGWRHASFRGFADYMATPEFSDGIDALVKIAGLRETAIMCAEAVPWKCHRSLISDALVKRGWNVRDIMSRTGASRHRLTPFLKIKKGKLVYPASKT